MTQSTCSQNSLLPVDAVIPIIQRQRDFFASGQTRPLPQRLEQLRRLLAALDRHQDPILAAVATDLGKPHLEAYVGEVEAIRSEVRYAIKHLGQWVKPRTVATSLLQFPAQAWIQAEPLGVVLIIGPWNYPISLMLQPLVGAIAAGNCALLKPSEVTPNAAAVLAELVRDTFDPGWVTVVEGGIDTCQALLSQRFDHIFFTGGSAIGKVILRAAAPHLTPVTLELGGKSPCIVEPDSDLDCAARRITWGKFFNGGQTCIAPDYLLVNREIAPALIARLKACITEFYSDNPQTSPDYGRIVSDRHFQRLVHLLESGTVVAGGQVDARDRYIAPTLLEGVTWADPVMQEEIFGPILPILTYDHLSVAIAQIQAQPKPLALYFFGRDRQQQQQVLQNTSSGGVCLNDTLLQVGVVTLPFGGVGASGMGTYHGKATFDTFSHSKSVVRRFFGFDPKFRYAPYQGKLAIFKRLLR
ncbi:aldehyde dehydrogenase family protein [Prochlorothrix hollandica]|uniref:Aldehyde dehydrogenase n=1 Tax=Prochlorothrix hollandica PCC 9006 = CALU 1027 TaxID=317619 RepID=A0A0M2PUW0_PROHO|nr:aldehyde dehydrogenase family protein [Prochlorothrix hollandica]KKI99904.1 aldehyde dehydrogenase [Prochlorothrix hollandica PCC 9006 = CALU 1027]